MVKDLILQLEAINYEIGWQEARNLDSKANVIRREQLRREIKTACTITLTEAELDGMCHELWAIAQGNGPIEEVVTIMKAAAQQYRTITLTEAEKRELVKRMSRADAKECGNCRAKWNSNARLRRMQAVATAALEWINGRGETVLGESGQPGSGHSTPQLSSVNLQSATVSNPSPATKQEEE
jgi:hypothetical protein